MSVCLHFQFYSAVVMILLLVCVFGDVVSCVFH